MPWRTGYSGVLCFATEGVGKQLRFYAVQALAQLGPVVLGAAPFAFWRPSLLTPFVSVHQDALHLVEHALRAGHEAYLVLEPPNRDHPTTRRLLKRYDAQKIAELPIIWAQLPVYRLRPKHTS